MRWSPVIWGLVIGMVVAPVSNLQAQDFTGQPIRVGESQLVPEVRLEYVSSDNAFRTQDNEVDYDGFIASPAVRWTADRRLLTLSATYLGSYGVFSEDVLDYDDHQLLFQLDASPATRHRVSAGLLFNRLHEDFGTGQTEFLSAVAEQTVTNVLGLDTRYTFGAAQARGNLGAGLQLRSITYEGADEIIQGDDHSIVRPFAFFSYRLSPDTRFVTELRVGELDFDQDARDRTELSALLGLDLAATEKSGGQIRLGVTDADYDLEAVSDTTEFIADVNLYFRPRSYSRIDLNYVRDLDTIDGNLAGAADSVTDKVSLRWRHDWSSRFFSTVSLAHSAETRTCPSDASERSTAGLELDLQIRRWLSVGVGAAVEQRTTDICDDTLAPDARDYDRSEVGAHLRVTL